MTYLEYEVSLPWTTCVHLYAFVFHRRLSPQFQFSLSGAVWCYSSVLYLNDLEPQPGWADFSIMMNVRQKAAIATLCVLCGRHILFMFMFLQYTVMYILKKG